MIFLHYSTRRFLKTAMLAGTILTCGLNAACAQNPPDSGTPPPLPPPPPRLIVPSSPVIINVDAAAGRHRISPYIYGLAYADTAALIDLNVILNRSGGNNTSRYNWKLNADNRGNDWFYESIPDASTAPGERGDTFITNTRAAGAIPMLTVPMVGWVAKVGPHREKLASFSQAKYGPQQKSDPYLPDAGNGKLKVTGKDITNNDPNDANVPSDPDFQQGWIKHLVERWAPASREHPHYYLMDNEPSIWQGTHRDVHPVGATMAEVRDRILDYGRMIKAVDPGAILFGPEEWGWSGYIYSGYDQQYGAEHGWKGPLPDRQKHEGMDYLPWLLDQMRQDQQATGKRILDVFSVHIYPQGGEFGNDTSRAMQLRRNRSTRALWDPNYVDETWIKEKVRLIPRLKEWVQKYYPNTPIAITEYNWGAEGHINGATAQADILGIFGREGLNMATRWTTPAAGTPTYNAIKIYRNYDGQRSGFGDISLTATAPNPDTLSSFAAERSTDHALTVMLVHKALDGEAPVTVRLAHFTAGTAAQVWQLTATNRIERVADAPIQAGQVSLTLPAQSITLLVVPKR